MTNPFGPAYRPLIVRRWDNILSDESGPEAATSQLVYEMLLQMRTIKLILAWVLIVLPAMAVALIIVLNVLASKEIPNTGPYGF